jgi:drug/metabolite transporter (DMT)-like permease
MAPLLFGLGRLAAGLVLALAGATALSWPGDSPAAGRHWTGSLLVAAACFAWGLDNNLSQRISGKDPVAITSAKGPVAGLLVLGEPLTPPLAAGAALMGAGVWLGSRDSAR